MAPDADTALSPHKIQALLRTETLGRTLHVFENVDSTNRAALVLAGAETPDGTVVIAETQTAGRGRLGRVWHSPSGDNLYCSILLRGVRASEHLSAWLCWLPLVTGSGVLSAIRTATGLEPVLKWPNDVLVRDRKVAGVLCETAGVGTACAWVVVGIGVNVNTLRDQFPSELSESATSLASELGRRLSRVELLATMLKELESRYAEITSTIPLSITQEYTALCSTLGRLVRVSLSSGEVIEGVADSLTTAGALSVIQADTGRSRRIHAGDVVHVR